MRYEKRQEMPHMDYSCTDKQHPVVQPSAALLHFTQTQVGREQTSVVVSNLQIVLNLRAGRETDLSCRLFMENESRKVAA